jgi:hypothetical protein
VNSLLEQPSYLEGIIVLEYPGQRVYIAPVDDIAHDGADTNVTFNLGVDVATVAAASPTFGCDWDQFETFEVGVCTSHFATDQMTERFFIPNSDIDEKEDPPENTRTGSPADDYFRIAVSGDENNLLVPTEIRLSPAMNSAAFDVKLVVHRFEAYMMAAPKTELYNFVTAAVNFGGVPRQVLRLFAEGTTDYVDVKELEFSYGTTFQFICIPDVLQAGLDIIGADQEYWPQRTALEAHAEYGCLGDRVVGFRFEAADAVLCGPISPCPQLEIKRPVNNGAIMLPPRLGNYELNFKFATASIHRSVNNNLYECARSYAHPLKIQCEYLQETGDQAEHISMNLPKFELWSLPLTTDQTVFEHTFTHGRPQFVYIVHHGDLKRFSMSYRGKACPALLNADVFALFKMFNRCVHPSSIRTFREWVDDAKPYLIRWEELGLWAQTKENAERFIVEFEVLESGNEQEIDVYFVYENFFLESTHNHTKFTYVE